MKNVVNLISGMKKESIHQDVMKVKGIINQDDRIIPHLPEKKDEQVITTLLFDSSYLCIVINKGFAYIGHEICSTY